MCIFLPERWRFNIPLADVRRRSGAPRDAQVRRHACALDAFPVKSKLIIPRQWEDNRRQSGREIRRGEETYI